MEQGGEYKMVRVLLGRSGRVRNSFWIGKWTNGKVKNYGDKLMVLCWLSMVI